MPYHYNMSRIRHMLTEAIGTPPAASPRTCLIHRGEVYFHFHFRTRPMDMISAKLATLSEHEEDSELKQILDLDQAKLFAALCVNSNTRKFVEDALEHLNPTWWVQPEVSYVYATSYRLFHNGHRDASTSVYLSEIKSHITTDHPNWEDIVEICKIAKELDSGGTLAWMPMQKKKPNRIAGSLPIFSL